MIFQKGEYTKPMGFDGWFLKGGSTQNRWDLELYVVFLKLSARGVYLGKYGIRDGNFLDLFYVEEKRCSMQSIKGLGSIPCRRCLESRYDWLLDWRKLSISFGDLARGKQIKHATIDSFLWIDIFRQMSSVKKQPKRRLLFSTHRKPEKRFGAFSSCGSTSSHPTNFTNLTWPCRTCPCNSITSQYPRMTRWYCCMGFFR